MEMAAFFRRNKQMHQAEGICLMGLVYFRFRHRSQRALLVCISAIIEELVMVSH